MAPSNIQCLPNELFLSIFNYLSTIDRLFAFYNLNIRFNNLLKKDLTQIDLSNCRRSRFTVACETILTNIERPFSLKISLKRRNESVDELFIQLQSHNANSLLKSMTLVDVTEQSIQDVTKYFNGFSNLLSWTIIYDTSLSAQYSLQRIFNLNMASVKYLKIDYNGKYEASLDRPFLSENTPIIPNITELVLRVPITLTTFRQLLRLLPQVISMEVILRREWRRAHDGTSTLHTCQRPSKLKRLVLKLSHKDSIDRVGFADTKNLLQELPQLDIFWCTAFFWDNAAGQQYQDGKIWEDFIREYLPNLIDFRLNIAVKTSSSEYHPSNVIKSFCTPFWNEEKKWCFIADHLDNTADTIELYSLPPPEPSTVVFCPYSRWVSNSRNPNFAGVKTLSLAAGSYNKVDTSIENRYYPKVSTIRPASRVDSDDLNYVSNLSNHINLRSITSLTILSTKLIEALPKMTSLIKLECRICLNDFECFKILTAPILQLKILILAPHSPFSYHFKHSELNSIQSLFPNLEYVQVGITQINDLYDFINGMPHLICIIVYYEQEENNKKKIKEWIENNAAIGEFKVSLQRNRIALWLY